MKKWIIIIICCFAFYKGIQMIDKKANVELFDEYYELDYPTKDESDGPSYADKIKEFFKDLFTDKDEKFIYK